MKWLIWVPDHGETAECSGVEFDYDRPRWATRLIDAAEGAAEHYADEAWCNWGWKVKWPIEFRLRDLDSGAEFDVTVDCEYDPSFSSGPAKRVWRGDEIYLNVARYYAPAEARR